MDKEMNKTKVRRRSAQERREDRYNWFADLVRTYGRYMPEYLTYEQAKDPSWQRWINYLSRRLDKDMPADLKDMLRLLFDEERRREEAREEAKWQKVGA